MKLNASQVTLGGSGLDRGSTRHPQLGAGSLLGAAVTVMPVMIPPATVAVAVAPDPPPPVMVTVGDAL